MGQTIYTLKARKEHVWVYTSESLFCHYGTALPHSEYHGVYGSYPVEAYLE